MIILRISVNAIRYMATFQAVVKIQNFIRQYYQNVMQAQTLCKYAGQVWRILQKMAEIKRERPWAVPFDVAKEVLKEEKTILSWWNNNKTDCAQFFGQFWNDLEAKGYIITLF